MGFQILLFFLLIKFFSLKMNIFVAKLNFSTEESTIRALFESYGEVDSAKLIMDRETGRSKGYAFVEMPNEDEGNKAIAELNESELDGRAIVVKKARPREERSEGGHQGGGFQKKRFTPGGGGGGYNKRY